MSDLELAGMGIRTSTRSALTTALCLFALGVALASADLERGWAKILVSPLAGGRLLRMLLPMIMALSLLAAALMHVLLATEELRAHASQLAVVFVTGVAIASLLTAATRANSVDAERIVARQRSKKSDQRYRLLAENATDVVWQLDPDDTIEWVSASVKDELGWTPEQMLGTNLPNLVHPEDLARMQLWREGLGRGRIRHRCRLEGGAPTVAIGGCLCKGEWLGTTAPIPDSSSACGTSTMRSDQQRRWHTLVSMTRSPVWLPRRWPWPRSTSC